MASDHESSPLSLGAKFTREVEHALARDSSQSAKRVFFDVWRRLKPEYEAMHQALNQYLNRQLEESSIRATLYSRLKKDDSISKSIDRREQHWGTTYDSPKLILDGIHDLVGFRIIVDYPSGLDQSYQLIKNHFSVEGINTFSTDRDVGVLWKPRFGAYEGKNFQVRMSPDKHNTGLSVYYEVLFEIQVTSIAESLYNRLAHPLHYKKSSGTLSRQDEMIIDMSHGLSLCYWITIACMEETLEGKSGIGDQTSPLPHTVRKIAGHDADDTLDDLDDLVKITPEIPVISGDRSLGSSRAGSSRLKRTAPSDDIVSIEILLKSLSDIRQEHRSDAEIWNGIRDKLGLDNGTYNGFLKSFTYDRMNDRKTSIHKRHRNTFEWVFGDEELEDHRSIDDVNSSDDLWSDTTSSIENGYSEEMDNLQQKSIHRRVEVPSLANWLQDDIRGLYWVSGKPGSGKSYFMKFLERDERTQVMLQKWQPRCRIISHYLWKPGSDDQSSFKGMICSLVHQILHDEKAIAMRLLRETRTFSYKNYATDWDTEDVENLLFNILNRSTHPYLILIDGLDEMSKPHDGMNQVFQVLDALAKLDRVKVCVSSRPENIFVARFKSQPSLRMQDLTLNDIRKYTIDKLKELDLELDDEKFEMVTYQISERAEGVFIWVYMVLKQIKHGVDEFCETWDDIIDRVDELPSDLMSLYRNMLSRFGDNDERYIKKAARYFQYILKKPARVRCDIAMLSLAANENVLDAFTTPEHTPCADEWVKLCRTTENTFFSISAGLLETKTEEDWFGHALTSEGDSKIIPWVAKSVDFIHKTAIDFLESEEGKQLFGKYAMGTKDILMMYVKVHLVLRSVTRHSIHPLLFLFGDIVDSHNNPLGEMFYRDSHDVLSLVHACSINKSRGLVRPPRSVSYENFFLFQISHFYCYEYVESFLKSCTYSLEASAYALIGACESDVTLSQYYSGSYKRFEVIRDILRYQSTVHGRKNEGPSVEKVPILQIMWAWRCFLLHELSWYNQQSMDNDSKQLFGEILGLFVKLGVMAEVPGPKYLLARPQRLRFHVVKDLHDHQSDLGYTSLEPQGRSHQQAETIYIEVNDAWLLRQLLERRHILQNVEHMMKDDPFMRVLLANNGREYGEEETDFFFITTNEDIKDDPVDSITQLDYMATFPHEEHSNFKATALGRFTHVTPVLETIGYNLPDVNKSHVCLHEWTWL
ncbi:hypothetical protein FPSE_08083 [Fusarium pseudograminearum CS3096]|uniref:RelA/SpoT domain-containing protein n=1 Tax=Fusarium pseudograminearum (strain CS3096) TaxID=1028729 RepID=K3VCG6_FUSPC|nr:hypothetical protein FPSE_08083 [Fusarium pseudograminearum CS3096]EKJ71637.1 hypothetical protein FPSE_08083 [Fusarium pseudograminearum CS3096]